MRGKILSALKNKRGASMLFVLAVTMLLLAIGTSALVAAAASSAAGSAAVLESRMSVYANSVIKSFTAALRSTDKDGYGKTLQTEIFEKIRILGDAETELPKDKIPDIPVKYSTTAADLAFGTPVVPGIPGAPVENSEFTLSFAEPITFNKVAEIAKVPAVFADLDGNPTTPETEVSPEIPRVPSVRTVNAFDMTLSITVKLGTKTVSRQVVYRCDGITATFALDPVGGPPVVEKTADPIYTLGKWEAVNYGKIA